MNAKEINTLVGELFDKRQPLLALMQDIAENFYPERAEFTVKKYLGNDFAGNLMTSYPQLCRRDLGNSIGTMLRDSSKPWFHMTIANKTDIDHESMVWLQWASETMRRAMYDPKAFMQRAAKLGDHDFASFGMDAIQVRLNKEGNGLNYRCHHLRDVIWMEDENGEICLIARRWKPYARDLVEKFKKSALRPKNGVHLEVERIAKNKPFTEVECMHIMVVADMYNGDAGKGAAKKPWRSIYYDCAHSHEMESIAQWNKEYVISRWQTVGTQYSMSPAVIAALPESRLLQSMTFTLLEAGEKIVSPALTGVEQAVRSDVDLSAGGITWIDYEYQYPQHALIPIKTDAGGMPIGQEMQNDSRQLLARCFYLDKIKPFMPTQDPQMTAFQAGQIVSQYIRDALPLFEPMEAEKNGGLCLETFECMRRANGFGPVQQIPKALLEADVDFRFASPLHDLIESQKGAKFLEMGQLIAQATALDKGVLALPKATDALRDALNGIQVPAKWIRSQTEVKQMQDAQAVKQQVEERLAAMGQGADVAATLGGAVKNISQSQLGPQQTL